MPIQKFCNVQKVGGVNKIVQVDCRALTIHALSFQRSYALMVLK